jgi:hypothetical protein
VIERLEPDAYVLAVHVRLFSLVIARHSRSKNGVVLLAYARQSRFPLRRCVL